MRRIGGKRWNLNPVSQVRTHCECIGPKHATLVIRPFIKSSSGRLCLLFGIITQCSSMDLHSGGVILQLLLKWVSDIWKDSVGLDFLHKRNKIMEKGRSVATKRRLETDKCLRCSLWMFSGIAISLMVILLGFTIWTLVSYQNTVTALQSRVDKLEVDLDLIRSGKEALIAKTVEEEVSKVMFPIMTYLISRF